jgi:NAD(P)-dependent dehydrogenase (short-subunit alcohol dehydrogenase family)
MPTERAEIGAGVADVDLSGRTVLVTGATDGIGRETALALGRLGAHVIVHGRSREKGMAALDALAATDAAGAELRLTDYASLDAVRDLATAVRDEHGELDVLVNNAGGYFTESRTTDVGVEYTFHVNHLAPFVLTNLLVPALAPAGGRIVTVSSEAHRGASMEFEAIREPNGGFTAYGRSKLANVLFTYELARRYDAGPANCLHPGFVPGSGFGRQLPAPARLAMTGLGLLPDVVTGWFSDSVVSGAETPVYLAASPEAAEVTGNYFENCRPRRSNDASYDERTQGRLWEVSVDLAGLDPGEVVGGVEPSVPTD